MSRKVQKKSHLCYLMNCKLQTCPHNKIHTYTHTYINIAWEQTEIHTYRQKYIHIDKDTYIYIDVQIDISLR